jgi:hypothetical protein
LALEKPEATLPLFETVGHFVQGHGWPFFETAVCSCFSAADARSVSLAEKEQGYNGFLFGTVPSRLEDLQMTEIVK